jgi:hypothetical protein
MNIPIDLTLIWPGAHADIPDYWARNTDFDSRFPKGSADGYSGGTNGGNATHTHTSPVHYHNVAAHTHAYATTDGMNESSPRTGNGGPGIGGPNHHHHGNSGSPVGTTSSEAVTYGAVSNDPPFRKVIYIKALAGARLEDDIVAFWNSNTAPDNWAKVTSMQGRYLKGAGTGADADLATDNGSYTNVHDISHGHASSSHYHNTANSGQPEGDFFQTAGGPGTPYCSVYHVHAVSFGSQSTAVTDFSGSLTTTETVEPVYRKLQAIQKGAGGLKEIGIIGIWPGSLALIPKGWKLCNGQYWEDGVTQTPDMRDKFLKIGDPADGTGGANTHVHGAQVHSHTGASHNGHSVTFYTDGNDTGNQTGPTDHGVTQPHQHTMSGSLGAGTANFDNANTTADSSDNQPEFRTVVYIQYTKAIYSGAAIFSLLN